MIYDEKPEAMNFMMLTVLLWELCLQQQLDGQCEITYHDQISISGRYGLLYGDSELIYALCHSKNNIRERKYQYH